MQPRNLTIAVDPGVSGALVISNGANDILCCEKFTTIGDMRGHIARAADQHPLHTPVAWLESVHSSPGMGVKSSFTFGQNFGEWCGLFAGLQIPVNLIKPQQWQRMITGLKGKKDAERKNALKAEAQRLFPSIKVTLKNADALLINHCVVSKK